MKFESDTEIDSLLRRQARRESSSASSTAGSVLGANGDDERQTMGRAGGAAHLDADEMNAFAEGALSDASRARYFAHLADCDECRGLVTKLTLAANVAIEPSARATTVEASTRSSWRDWLSAFFAPPVLRYAVPALALMAVIVVAFIATRPQLTPDSVARNETSGENVATPPANQVSQKEQQANTTTATTATSNTTAAAAPQQSANANAKVGEQPEAVKNTAPLTAQRRDDAGLDVTVLNDAPKPAEKTPTGGAFGTQARDNNEVVRIIQEPPPPVAVAPANSAPVPNSSVEEDAEAKAADANKKDKASATSLGRNSSGIVLDGVTKTERAQESGRREGPAARRSRPADTQSSRATADADGQDKRSAETTSAGGRQFRRQGGVWIDTAYSASRSIVNVARGSEQYRALVADEPGIRAIADKLGGTVIVVWKQRTYRIY